MAWNGRWATAWVVVCVATTGCQQVGSGLDDSGNEDANGGGDGDGDDDGWPPEQPEHPDNPDGILDALRVCTGESIEEIVPVVQIAYDVEDFLGDSGAFAGELAGLGRYADIAFGSVVVDGGSPRGFEDDGMGGYSAVPAAGTGVFGDIDAVFVWPDTTTVGVPGEVLSQSVFELERYYLSPTVEEVDVLDVAITHGGPAAWGPLLDVSDATPNPHVVSVLDLGDGLLDLDLAGTFDTRSPHDDRRFEMGASLPPTRAGSLGEAAPLEAIWLNVSKGDQKGQRLSSELDLDSSGLHGELVVVFTGGAFDFVATFDLHGDRAFVAFDCP